MSSTDTMAGFSTPEQAEAAFYAAFSACDEQAMQRVWAEREVSCIHPGSDLLLGRALVMQSWAQILGNAEAPEIEVQLISRNQDKDLAVHLVEEYLRPRDAVELPRALVLATNLYRREADGWHMIGHHASTPPQRSGEHVRGSGEPLQ